MYETKPKNFKQPIARNSRFIAHAIGRQIKKIQKNKKLDTKCKMLPFRLYTTFTSSFHQRQRTSFSSVIIIKLNDRQFRYAICSSFKLAAKISSSPFSKWIFHKTIIIIKQKKKSTEKRMYTILLFLCHWPHCFCLAPCIMICHLYALCIYNFTIVYYIIFYNLNRLSTK